MSLHHLSIQYVDIMCSRQFDDLVANKLYILRYI